VTLTRGDGVGWKAAELYGAKGSLLASSWCQRDQGVVTNSVTANKAVRTVANAVFLDVFETAI
jgi:hypothetical protein